MNKITLAVLAASTSLLAATSADAATTFTVSGSFSGTLYGDTFNNVDATFTGIGADKPQQALDGAEAYLLSSLSVFVPATSITYTFSGTNLRYFANGVTSLAGFRVNATNQLFSFDTQTGSIVSGTSTIPGYALSSSDGRSGTVFFSSGTGITSAITPPAVPEPAAWAMMIAGMGAIGVAMRRRKIRTSVSFA